MKPKELPTLMNDLWDIDHHGLEMTSWKHLNLEHDDSDEWGCDVYFMEGKGAELYGVLTPQGLARRATSEEIHFLLTGEIPESCLIPKYEDTEYKEIEE